MVLQLLENTKGAFATLLYFCLITYASIGVSLSKSWEIVIMKQLLQFTKTIITDCTDITAIV